MYQELTFANFPNYWDSVCWEVPFCILLKFTGIKVLYFAGRAYFEINFCVHVFEKQKPLLYSSHYYQTKYYLNEKLFKFIGSSACFL